MADSIRNIYDRWRLAECLSRYPSLRISPSSDQSLHLKGDIDFNVTGPDGTNIRDTFLIEIEIPTDFPSTHARAREIGGRIPEKFHKLKDNWLCLGSPTAIKLTLVSNPTITCFIEKLIIPYLYGFAFFELHKKMPYGELDHGTDGLLQHFTELFRLKSRDSAKRMVLLAGSKKRPANKQPCPCGSGKRLGRCHHKIVNHLRNLLTRKWFKSQAKILLGNNEKIYH